MLSNPTQNPTQVLLHDRHSLPSCFSFAWNDRNTSSIQSVSRTTAPFKMLSKFRGDSFLQNWQPNFPTKRAAKFDRKAQPSGRYRLPVPTHLLRLGRQRQVIVPPQTNLHHTAFLRGLPPLICRFAFVNEHECNRGAMHFPGRFLFWVDQEGDRVGRLQPRQLEHE